MSRDSLPRGALLKTQLGREGLEDAQRPLVLAIHVSGLPKRHGDPPFVLGPVILRQIG